MKTREEIEAIAAKKYPCPSEPFIAFSDDYGRKMYTNAKHNQKVFIEGYEQAQNDSQWISVDERLPDEFESLNGIEMPSECRYACHRSGEHFESDETGDFINITHWQYATTPTK